MVERRVCTFCGGEIEPGTGRMYIKKDGVVFHFCTSKCFKNMIHLRRVPRRTTWTRFYEREKQVRLKGEPEAVPEKKAKKLRKGEGAKPVAEVKESPKEPAKKEERASAPSKPTEKSAVELDKKPAPKDQPPKKAPSKKSGSQMKEKPAPKKVESPKPAKGEGQ
ncbi:MAG TPA: 50S ribosomal protein L24e [Thermoplasmata archaeon]